MCTCKKSKLLRDTCDTCFSDVWVLEFKHAIKEVFTLNVMYKNFFDVFLRLLHNSCSLASHTSRENPKIDSFQYP